jgi:hypothetical protein
LTGAVEPAEAYRQRGTGRGRGWMGDLIELESSSDTVEDQPREHEGILGAVDGPVSARSSRDLKMKGKANAGANVTATEEALLRERFPPRGRMVDAQTGSGRRR